MPIVTLSAEFTKNAKCPTGKPKETFYDTSITGFVLEVRSTGGMTFALRYRDAYGKQIQHKIGDTKSISFDKARNAAQILRSKVVLGEDPSEAKRIKRNTPTLNDFNREQYLPFIKTAKPSWKSDDQYLRNHVLPRFGSYHLDSISQQEITKYYHGLRERGYALATCNRILVLIKYMFNVAIKWKVPGVTTNPAIGIKFFELNNGREKFLTVEETQRLKVALENSESSQLKNIVALLLLTGARKRELLEARWEHVDIGRRIWTIPKSKTGLRHVPLSSAALSVLAQLPRYERCPYVIPNPQTLQPFSDLYGTWNKARTEAGLPGLRIHDLRHSMASNMVNSGRSLYEVAKVLGHSQLSTTQRYSHLSQTILLEAVNAAADATGMNWDNPKEAK